jgi:hypothetical protein
MPITLSPTNTTPETAFVLNGQTPLDAIVDLRGLANPQRIWFRYNLGTLYYGWAVWAHYEQSTDGVQGYNPRYKFYFDDPYGTPSATGGPWPTTAYGEDAVGVPKTGVLYISLENGYVGATFVPTTTTSLRIDVHENAALPAGSPIINNDIEGFPMTLLSPTGEPTQIRSFVAGESAANLENGISLWSEAGDTNTLHLYSADLQLITEITWPRGHLRAPISSNRKDTFYAATRNIAPGEIASFSQTGGPGPEWSITNLAYTRTDFYHIAPSLVDSDVIYVYVSFTPYISGYFGISRFHKSTQAIDPRFVSADDATYNLGGFYGNEFLVLPDDSTLLMFRGDADSKVKLFSSSGTLVRDFVIPGADVNRIAYDGVTYTAFWTWSFLKDTFESRFTRFRISDGVILEQFTVPTTSSGQIVSDVTGAPLSLFGVPECCPFLTTTTELPPYGSLPPEEVCPAGVGFPIDPDEP